MSKLSSIFKMFTKQLSLGLVVIVVMASFLAGVLFGGQRSWQNDRTVKGTADSESEDGQVNNKDDLPDYLKNDLDFSMFWDVWQLVLDDYYEKDIPETKLFYGAMAGIVASLGDPYSVFLTPTNSEEFQDELEGNFEGIGIEIGLRNNQLTVISPLPDSPALAAGLRAKDIIVSVDGEDTADMSLQDAVGKIRGKDGTEVVLRIFRPETDEFKDATIVRAAITIKSLTWEIVEDKVMHIKVRQFNGDTMTLFQEAMLELSKRPDIKSIVLDLRNNPGGYLETAIEMSSQWVEKGQIVVSEKLRDGREIKHSSQGPADLSRYKTIVLVNEGSASASEIVAGALKDLKKATIVGMTTFGKGSVQDLTDLPDGSAVKLTIAKWFTPSGLSIDERGVAPDVETDITEDDYNAGQDPQLDRALELAR